MIRRLLAALLGVPVAYLHPDDVPNRYDVAAAQAIQDADDESCALTRPTPAVEAGPITELAPWPVDDFAAWEKELTNR